METPTHATKKTQRRFTITDVEDERFWDNLNNRLDLSYLYGKILLNKLFEKRKPNNKENIAYWVSNKEKIHDTLKEAEFILDVQDEEKRPEDPNRPYVKVEVYTKSDSSERFTEVCVYTDPPLLHNLRFVGSYRI